MRIEYLASKSQRTVPDEIGETLIARKLARRVYETRELAAGEHPMVDAGERGAESIDGPEISPRTGKPKRQYKRRDLTAEG